MPHLQQAGTLVVILKYRVIKIKISMKYFFSFVSLLFVYKCFGQQQNMIVTYPTNNLAVKNRTYSQVVSVDLGNSTMLVISGQIPLNENGDIVGKDNFEKQTVQVFENLKYLIQKNGGTLNQIVKTGIYLTDIKNLDLFRKIRATYFDSINPPASTLVQVQSLYRSDILLEIEATAIIPKDMKSELNNVNRQAVHNALMDYLEAFYYGDTTKIIRSISKSVTKYGYWMNEKSKIYEGSAMPFEKMLAWVKEKSKKLNKQFSGIEKIEIYEVLDKTASAKVTGWWGSDYVLLEKLNEKWLLTMILWQSPYKE
jgi:2-iminobutanoate/2-iminopropanoate deaminase